LVPREGRTADAKAAYARAAELDLEAFAPRNNLAELLRAEGDLGGALRAAQEAFALAGDDPYVMDTLGWLYLEKGLVGRALGLLEGAHRGAPAHPVIQLHLALAYRRDGRIEAARVLLSDLERRTRTDPDLHAQVEQQLRSL
jgi:tetratricopeptide (TPR) repeat protein